MALRAIIITVLKSMIDCVIKYLQGTIPILILLWQFHPPSVYIPFGIAILNVTIHLYSYQHYTLLNTIITCIIS